MGPNSRLAKASVLLVCLLVPLIDAAANKCKTGCHGMDAGKAYQVGKTYVYDYDGKTTTFVTEAEGEATLKLKATVELSVLPDCIHQVKLKNVQVNGAPVPAKDVEQYALQYNYHNGHIDTEVCAESGDSQTSINVKRAVVSLLQSAVLQESGSRTSHEIDVFGSCPTDFNFRKEGDDVVVQKQKNLGQCSHRENLQQGLVSAAFDPMSDVTTSPVLGSHQSVEQRFKNGIMQKAESRETYRFKPFSNGESGAKTTVESSLTLKSEKANSAPAAVTEPKSLIFDAPHPVVHSSVDAITNALKAARDESGELKKDAAEKFSDLVKVLRVSSKNDILSVYHKVSAGAGFDKVTDKNTLLSALFRTGSGEAAEVAVELIKNREITDFQSHLFYASLVFVRHVNLPTVTGITSLLDLKNVPRLGYLGIGHVIGKYCQEHNCENVPEVKNAVQKIREKVGNGKATTREAEDLKVTALKALGNAKFLDDATLQKLANIALDENVKSRVRVTAMESLPARCSMKWKTPLLKLLANQEEDSEIRIKAYLALVACPCPQVANKLKEILDNEKINQVGSFITSHLRNLRSTVDPTKQEARRQFGQIGLRTKFPEDFRKFSFNNEFSYNLGAFGIGSSVDSNVIYSQNSFVPRSTSLNMTTEIFGRSFNFLELNTRVENLDRIIEHYFGPKGYFKQNLEDLPKKETDELQDLAKYIKEKAGSLARRRRDVKQSELDQFAKNVHLPNREVDDELDIDLSAKLFGVEVLYQTYHGRGNKFNPKDLVDKFFDGVNAGFKKAKNFDYTLDNHMHFLDVQLTYPTGLGLPLKLGVSGTGVVHLKTSGKIDIPAILKDPKNAAIEFALEPSANIRVGGKVAVEGFEVESGVKVVMTLHTSTGSQLSVKVLNGNGIDISLGIPQKKQDIIDVSSEVLLTTGPKGKQVQPNFGKGKSHSDCFEQFSSLFGVTICGNVLFPYEDLQSVQKRPFFPLSGPSKFAVTVENTDVTTYHFRAFYNDQNPDALSAEVVLETPNSKTNRRIAFTVVGTAKPDKSIRVALDSPIRKLSAEAVLKNTQQEKSLKLTFDNDQMEYFARIGLLAEGSKYKPILEYKVPEHIEQLASAKTGNRKTGEGQQYNVQGTVDVADHNNGKKYTFEKVALVSNGRQLAEIDGYVAHAGLKVDVDLLIGYGPENLALKLNGNQPEENHYVLAVSAKPSKDPNIGFNLDWDLKRSAFELDSKFVFVHGADPKSELNRLTVEYHGVNRIELGDQLAKVKLNKVGRSIEVTYPAMGLETKLKGYLLQNGLDAEVKFKYANFKLGTELSVEVGKNKVGDYEVEFEAELMDNSFEFEAKRTVTSPTESKFENSLKLTPGGKYTANAVVNYDVKPNNVNVQVNANANLDGKKVKVDSGLVVNPQRVHSNALVSLDGTPYIDFILKVQRGANPNGDMNLNLKNYVNAVGKFNYQKGKGNANFIVEIPKIGRKIEANGAMTVTGTQHVANIEIMYDASKDPNKKLVFSTNTDFKNNENQKSLDTKNNLEVLSYKMEVNAKGSMKGTFGEGTIEGTADVTLPNGRYFTYSAKRSSARKDKKYDIDVELQLVDHITKGGQSRKFVYNAEARDADPHAHTFQTKSKLEYVDFDGKNVVLDLGLKNLEQNTAEGKQAAVNLGLNGNLIPKPFKINVVSNYDPNSVSVNGISSLGSDFEVKVTGLVERGTADKPYTYQAELAAKLPNEKLKSVKFSTLHSFQKPVEPSGKFIYKEDTTFTYNDDQTIKFECELNKLGLLYEEPHKSEGSGSFTLTVLSYPALTLSSGYKQDFSVTPKKVEGDLSVKYGNKEGSISVDGSFLPDFSNLDGHAKIKTTYEKLRNVDVKFNHKRENEGLLRKTEITVSADEAQYALTSTVQTDRQAPMIHVTFTCPKGKTEFLSKFQKNGERDYEGEYKLETPYGFVAAGAHIKLESVDDFEIDFDFDSDRIKQRKIHAEIANKPTAKAGRRIVITVTSDGKNIVTGNTSYKRNDEGNKVVVEGNGNLKIGEDTKSSSFKYTRKQLTKEVEGEVGVAMLLNVNFGPSAVVGELKVSNKEVYVSNSYCEHNKDCAHFKLQAVHNTDYKSHLKHEITVEVDLKKFNVPVEFGLKTNTTLEDFKFDHLASLYVHSQKDKSEYVYNFYIHPREAASILTLPTRELALVASFDIPKTKQTGAYKFEISHYLDRKNKPADKTSLLVNGDMNIDKTSGSFSCDAKFTYPHQSKDLSVKGRLFYGTEDLLDASLDLDVFAKKAQKIMVTAKVKRAQIPKGYNLTSNIEFTSRGQQLNVNLENHIVLSTSQLGFGSFLNYNDQHQKPKSVGCLFSASPEKTHVYVVSANKEVFKLDTVVDINKDSQKVNSELVVLGIKPAVIKFQANTGKDFSFDLFEKGNANNKLSASGKLVLGQVLEVHADAFKDGQKNHLFHVTVHLDDEKFLKPDFDYEKDNIIKTVGSLREKSIEMLKQVKTFGTDMSDEVTTEFKDLFEHLKKAQPNLTPLLNYYEAEKSKLKTELHADEAIKEIRAMFDKVFGGMIAAMTQAFKQLVERFEDLKTQFNVILSRLQEAFKNIYPQLKESYNKIFNAGVEIVDAASKLVVVYMKAVLNLINEHQKEIKELIAVAAELVQDVSKILMKGIGKIKKEVDNFVALLLREIKALPIYDVAKDKYQELLNFQVPEVVVTFLDDIHNAITAILPTDELRDFSNTVYHYLLKHIKREKVDDSAELKQIYSQGIVAFNSLIALIQNHVTVDNILNFVDARVPVDFGCLSKLMGFSSLKVSLFNLLRNNELPSLKDQYYAYKPTYYASDVLPPFSKTGIVVNGGHFFTFDGRHFTMPGTCNYILVQDFENGNFSVVASFENGNLAGITLTEPKESITLKSDGNVLVNNKPAEFPAHTKNLRAFLTPPAMNIKSDYGVHVLCNTEAPLICSVHVSGFYLGKLRGLLGDGNNEPYDDFTLPSGKLSASETEFGNSYKLKNNCPDATAVSHEQKARSPVCTEYFSSSSPMSNCFNYVNPTHYREACDYAVSVNSPKGACLLAVAYYAACRKENVFVSIPNACAKCKTGANTVDAGDTFSVKIPTNQADIVIVVEQEAKNEKIFKELVTPLVNDLRNELKQQGLTDVHVGLIGFGDHMKWPQHYTTSGSRNIKGDVKNMKFEKKVPSLTIDDAKEGNFSKKLEFFRQRLNIELGTIKLGDAYEEAIHYPFRAGATKAVIGVLATPCEKSVFPLSLQNIKLLVGRKIYRDLGLTYYHVSFPGDLISNDKVQKNVVGYDQHSAYTFADNKKKPLEGNHELKTTLVPSVVDVCADFAVASGGAAFSANNFEDGKANQKKQFAQVVARRVAEGLVDTKFQQDCACQLHHGIVGQARCKIVDRIEKESVRHAKALKG